MKGFNVGVGCHNPYMLHQELKADWKKKKRRYWKDKCTQDVAHWAGFAMSTREDRLASAAQFEEWLKSPGQNTAEAALASIRGVIAVFNYMQAIRQERQGCWECARAV